ncbi:MAG: Na/Pi symporter, partial [Clostridia bacterium]|nr:Na/Pi symporter [Clostridia bacterium]
ALAGAGGAGWLESALGGAGAGWGFLVGTAATALAFSSALVVGLLERLLQAGALGLGQAIPVLLGSDLGTVADTLLAAAALGRRARAVAAAHLLFNLAADLAWLLLGREALARAAGALAAAPAARLAMAHSLLNLLAALPLLPARRALARAALALAGAGAD